MNVEISVMTIPDLAEARALCESAKIVGLNDADSVDKTERSDSRSERRFALVELSSNLSRLSRETAGTAKTINLSASQRFFDIVESKGQATSRLALCGESNSLRAVTPASSSVLFR